MEPAQQRLFELGRLSDTAGRPQRPPGATEPAAGAAAHPTPAVEVRSSRRRRKSATAYWSEGRIVVLLPGHLRGKERAEMVDWLVSRVMAQRPKAAVSNDALFERAVELGRRYVPGVTPSSVRWVTNQHKRWASCTAESGEIRLSHRLKSVPPWVLDAVLVHELAHLVHPDHSAPFHAIAGRFKRQKEASRFLEGYALGLDSPFGGARAI
jgi:Zn-dependent protease with chaperone function